MLPKERSFPLQTINAWMSFFQYDFDPSPKYPDQANPNAKLRWFHHPDNPGYILKPSVMRVLNETAYPGEPYSKFLIEGDFGDDPGVSNREVRWGGQEMQVVRWAPDGVTIRMPASPPMGNIQVLMNKDFNTASNPVPFTYQANPESTGAASFHGPR